MDTNPNSSEAPEELSKEQWDELLAQVSEKARKRAWANGVPITIVRDNQIIRLWENGSFETVADLPKDAHDVTVSSKTIRIG